MTAIDAVGRRRAPEILKSVRVLIDTEYRTVVKSLPESLCRIGGYNIGWWDASGTPTAESGKYLRPALAILSSAAMSDGSIDLVRDRAIAAAVAVELVHNFTQLHDDIMDNDRIRRHRTSAWAQFGVGPAILAGDLFLFAATEVLSPYDHVVMEILGATLRELCEGQMADLSFEQRHMVSLDECFRMSEGKTAALLGAACELGAWAAGVDAQRRAFMRKFGWEVGRSCQLVDDLLGIFGDPEVTGKPVYADLIRRKKSLPVVAALNSDTAAGMELRQIYASSRQLKRAELAHVARLIENAGGRRWAEDMARETRGAAGTFLASADPTEEAAADLLILADFIMGRDH
ncbi:polyprenyl synthetase family protein [Nocardia terpenica]|uniref:polyprenyl synthetase family protein n=1 Tax=Nocardia terpenica TaxID=455432 RepID=UPI000835DBAC|nr:polyprenyl synthetase family protein [Nocardia terpenica]NQE91198.1 polyprenyl synthetase family protein [Nocardia terpenica]